MTKLYEGTLINQSGNIQESFYIRRLSLEDLKTIEKMQQKVIQALSEPAVFQPLSTEELLFILNGRGLILGAYAGKELIAFRALLVPPIDEEHLGRDFGLPDSELTTVIYQEISAVSPEYRGNRLQQTLAAVIMNELPSVGNQFRYIAGTVAPLNIPSMKDKFVQKMHIAALKEKYGGKLRYVFVKDLSVKEVQYVNGIAVAADDLAEQQKLLEEGYVGTGFTTNDNSLSIYFAKPVHS